MPAEKNAPRNVRIGLILGDQLDHESPVLQALSPDTDQLVMIEAGGAIKPALRFFCQPCDTTPQACEQPDGGSITFQRQGPWPMRWASF
jgi:hypothetical protein